MKKLLLLALLLCSAFLCQAQKDRIILGDEQTSEYFPILKDKKIAIFTGTWIPWKCRCRRTRIQFSRLKNGCTYPFTL